MTSLNNPTIDLDALMVALSHQSESLPSELQQQLTQAGQAFVDNQPNAAQTLRDLIRRHPPLETAYFQVLRQWDNDYTSQERAKSLTATFHTDKGIGFLFSQDVLSSLDWVSATQHITQRSTTNPRATDRTATWIRRGNTIVTMGCGGAFLGVLFAQIPGAIVGGILASLLAWLTSRPSTAQG
jgi:hypothetical protein